MPIGLNAFSIIVSVFYIILFIGCFVNMIAPKWYWRTFESWKATKEPSKTYFLTKRLLGIMGMIIISAIVLFPTLMAYFDK